jgi:hypothetical protein
MYRYEAAYRFGCRVRVTQPPPRSAAALAAAAFDRVFGRRTNCKLWAYAAARTATGPVEHPQLDVVGGGCGLAELLLATECSWANGATEGVVWEGVGLAAAALRARPATIELLLDGTTAAADGSPEGPRNIDGRHRGPAEHQPRIPNGSLAYPSLLDPASTSRNCDVVGRAPSLSFGLANPAGLKDQWDALVRVPLDFGNVRLATDDVKPALQPRPMVWMAEAHTTTAAGIRSYNLTRPVVFFLRASDADLATLATDGATLLATIHPAYAPYKTAMNESMVRAWCRDRMSKPFIHGVALDHEGWALQTPGLLRWLYEEAVRARKIFVNVPKITLDHLIVGTHSFEEQVAMLDRYTHGAAAWIYSYNGTEYLGAAARWRAAGFSKPLVPMGDGGFRPSYGGITPEIAADTIRTVAGAGLSFCLFMPYHGSALAVGQLGRSYANGSAGLKSDDPRQPPASRLAAATPEAAAPRGAGPAVSLSSMFDAGEPNRGQCCHLAAPHYILYG